MTTYPGFGSTKYNDECVTECGVWGEKTYTGAGAIIRVRGNDTEDKECEVLYVGSCSFKLPKDSNCEVTMVSSGNDTTLKVAVLTPPKDKQRRWKEDTGGIQHPTDPEHALEFNKTRAHALKDMFAVGPNGIFEVHGQDNAVYVRADKFIVKGEIITAKRVKAPEIVKGGEEPPGFTHKAEQDKVTDDSGGTGTA